MIVYEYPLNEKTRTYLRLEHLFLRLAQLSARSLPLDHHYALATMFEIMDIGARADLKSDILRDLDRQGNQLEGYRGNPAIAEGVLEGTLEQLSQRFQSLSQLSGKVGQALAENEWLMAIRGRMSIPGGTCGFDLPTYFAWQHQDSRQRQADLALWCGSFEPLNLSIQLLLKLLRDSGVLQHVVAASGQFQHNMPAGRQVQLLRLGLEEAQAVAPEFSGNRWMVSIRFMRQGEDSKPCLSGDNIRCQLTLCA